MDDTAGNCDYQSPKPTSFTLILNKPITNSQEAVVYNILINYELLNLRCAWGSICDIIL